MPPPLAAKSLLLPVLAMALLAAACGCNHQSQAAATAPQPQPAQAALKPAPATPIEQKKEDTGGPTWDPAWDAIVETALPSEFLSSPGPRDVRTLCPHFATMSEPDKRAFWAYFFQALAGAEAGLNPTTDVHHASVGSHDQVTHRPIRAEGLLQLTYEDAQRYHCDFDFEHDRTLPAKDPNRSILQPRNNLSCGVKILSTQLIEKHEPILARTSYWSTLRPGTASNRHFLKQMGNVPAACGLRPAVARACGALP